MPTFEGPVMADWPMPPGSSPEKYGQFIIASFDAVAAVACLEDEIASQAAAALPRSRFLGVVVGAGCLPMLNANGRHRLSVEVYLIGQGLPLEKDPAFSVPIAPAHTHPSNRVSPVLSTPLPWPNCYVHSLCNFLCLVSRIHYDPMRSPPFVLKKQRHEVMLQTMGDRNENIRRNLLMHDPPIPVPLTEGADADVSYYTDESEGSEDSPNEVDLKVAAVYAKTAKVQAFIEVWTDLSTCEDPATFANPKDFLPFIKQLDSISRDYETRMLARILSKPETASWVTAIAGTHVRDDTSSSAGEVPAAEGTDSGEQNGGSAARLEAHISVSPEPSQASISSRAQSVLDGRGVDERADDVHQKLDADAIITSPVRPGNQVSAVTSRSLLLRKRIKSVFDRVPSTPRRTVGLIRKSWTKTKAWATSRLRPTEPVLSSEG
ncbi:hypothetical protein EXIGLDRAFT_748749 [Exidia glandulosa HHB12029]|uniref:Uncharacterized protein n=1 Tax=Exidia glandulosa HHB12029 TaxID=1314781 RepID=A0A165J134_EXIGL|nr:hypothetical protein EXIGLDRAFT_748749 [Exidia glandulosa HHB12029]